MVMGAAVGGLQQEYLPTFVGPPPAQTAYGTALSLERAGLQLPPQIGYLPLQGGRAASLRLQLPSETGKLPLGGTAFGLSCTFTQGDSTFRGKN